MTFKNLFTHVLGGIIWGCTVFVIMTLIVFFVGGEELLQSILADYPKQVFGTIMIGIGWYVPSLVYQSERLSFPIQVLIHFFCGFTLFFPVAFHLNWIRVEWGWDKVFLIISGQIMISIMIWYVFYLYNKAESKKINARLAEITGREDASNK